MEALHRQAVKPRSRRAAAVIAALIVMATVLVMPNSAIVVQRIDAFLPMFAMAVFLTEGLTAYFLIAQFRSTGEAFYGALAGAYLFVALTVAVQILVFPGVFSANGLLGAGKQSAVWMWTFWHAGFPLLLSTALLLRLPTMTRLPTVPRQRLGFGLLIVGPVAALLLALLAVAGQDLMPPLITGGSYTSLRESLPGRTVIVFNLLALLTCLGVTRLRDLLSLWLGVAILASFSDSLLTLYGGARYSIGWYAARILSVLSSTTVLGVLIWEVSQLYLALKRAHDALAEKALRDGLTGARNRFYFNDQLQVEIGRALRDGTSLGVLLLDVDHFKRYNDRYGHQAGDACLIAVSKTICRHLRRPADFLARYGGEEFVVVMPNTDRAGAERVADIIRVAVAGLRLPIADHEPASVTISLGLAMLEGAVRSADVGQIGEQLIGRADRALYAAKHAGRNRLIVDGVEAGRPSDDATLVDSIAGR